MYRGMTKGFGHCSDGMEFAKVSYAMDVQPQQYHLWEVDLPISDESYQRIEIQIAMDSLDQDLPPWWFQVALP